MSNKRVRAVQRRVKRGEKLELKDYSQKHLSQFIETLKEELDKELALRLKGELDLIRPKIIAISSKLGFGIGGGFAGMTIGEMIVKITTLRTTLGMERIPIELHGQIDEATLFFNIIGGIIGFLLGFVGEQFVIANEENVRIHALDS